MLIRNNKFFRKEIVMPAQRKVTLFELFKLNQKKNIPLVFVALNPKSTSVYVNIEYVKFIQISRFESHRLRRRMASKRQQQRL